MSQFALPIAELKPALAGLGKVIAKRGTLPVLGNIRIERTTDGGVDAVCAFIQHLLQRFNPAGRITFEWSNDCSKPRIDAFGGGAAIVTAHKIKTMSTTGWLAKHAA